MVLFVQEGKKIGQVCHGPENEKMPFPLVELHHHKKTHVTPRVNRKKGVS